MVTARTDVATRLSVPDAGGEPVLAGGERIGDFFVFNDGAAIAWRWDPITRRWTRWALPKDVEVPKEPMSEAIRDVILHLSRNETPTAKPDDKGSPTATPSTNQMYSTGIQKFRDNIKWFIASAGAVAVALIGTAPLSGASAALGAGDRWSSAGRGLFLAIIAVVFVLLLAVWSLEPLEASLPFVARPLWLGKLPLWRRAFLRTYASHWASQLDGRAVDLPSFSEYRDAWLGTSSDIDRLLQRETDAKRQATLHTYARLAKERLEEDSPNVTLVLHRANAARIRRRTQIVIAGSAVLFALAAWGYIMYLSGSGTPPLITSIEHSDPLTAGQPFTIQVEATGSGFTYEWWRLPRKDPLPSATGPTLTVRSYTAKTAREYRVRVLAADGMSADTATITIPPSP